MATSTLSLVEAYLYEVHVTRKAHDKPKPTESSVEVVFGKPATEDEGKTLKTALTARIVVPIHETADAEVTITMLGHWQRPDGFEEPLPPAAVMNALWPPLRVIFESLMAQSELRVPPLPTADLIDVPESAADLQEMQSIHQQTAAQTAQ